MVAKRAFVAGFGVLSLLSLLQVFHAEQARAEIYVHQDRLTFQWTPASGCVDRYEFQVSRDGRAYRTVASSIPPNGTMPVRYTFDAQDQSVYQVRVRAVCDAYGAGPYSDPSEKVVVFLDGTPTDTDGDGMPDSWELANGFNPFDSSDADGDADQDGLSNRQEAALGTDPRNPDTDQDGATDWQEFQEGTDPLDSGDNVPVADAGPDQTRNPGVTVKLNGSNSWDPNGDPLSYLWKQESGPTVVLDGATNAICRFNGTQPGDYVFSLTVSDGKVWSAPDQVTVRIRQGGASQPVADAGRDFLAPLSGPAVLDGSGSYDPNNLDITYSWSQVSGPATAVLLDTNTAFPKFYPGRTGTYVFELTVSNGQAASPADSVTVHVEETLSPGDVHPIGAPDGLLTRGDAILIWLFYLGILVPTPDELFLVDVGPMKMVDSTRSPAWIRLEPDGALDLTDGPVLQGLFRGSYRVVGWELDSE